MRSTDSRVVVIGAGGHGSEVNTYIADLIRTGWPGEIVGFFDDMQPKGWHRGMEILGCIAEAAAREALLQRGLGYITALGDNSSRREVVHRIEGLSRGQLRAWTLIHPSAVVGNSSIGEGTLLAPGTIVTAGSQVGKHCILNLKATVSHDCTIEDFVCLNPGATVCGHCHIGEDAYIGAGATIIERIKVGRGAKIGAGAVVISDIPPNVTAVGVPARIVVNR
jgi:acetyltransferase EpsM